jgi:hypothetical protein
VSDIPAYKPRRHPEASLQSWVDRLIDRIVLPPMFVTGIDHASQTSDNARARMAGRGIRFGVPDVYVSQLNISTRRSPTAHPDAKFRSCWLELKRGSGLSSSQVAVHAAMRQAGNLVHVCKTTADVVEALRSSGFTLHPNADALAAEYEQRVIASETAPAKPRAPGRPRAKKASPGQVARARRSGLLV